MQANNTYLTLEPELSPLSVKWNDSKKPLSCKIVD